VRIQAKPLQLLQSLLEKPGEVVTREELQRRLWPSNTFVDFESGLNTATNRLRIALSDSSDDPRYIETLARSGYRFIAPVEDVAPVAAQAPAPPLAPVAAPQTDAGPARRFRRRVFASAIAVPLLAAIVWQLLPSRPVPFHFRQVTFRRGQVWGARFAPDGQSIVYTANWDNSPRQLYLTHPASPESRPLGFEDLRLVTASSSGELALLSFDGTLPITGGALSRAPINGGAPQLVDRNVMTADFAPDGRLAIVRAVSGINRIEFPPGNAIYVTAGWISSLRVSPAGQIAFLEHPVRHDDSGSLKLLDPGGAPRTLAGVWTSIGGVAWHPRGGIWFTAAREGGTKSLWAVSASGSLRSVAEIAGVMTLRDIAPDGRMLVTRETRLLEMAALLRGREGTRSLSWLDWSRVADVSLDGKLILFDESGIGAGTEHITYLHRVGERSTTRLGRGRAMALSPDGRFALTLGTRDRSRFRLLPLAEGQPRELPPTGLEYQWARYFPDGRLLALASEPGKPLRLYVQPLEGKPQAISPPMVVRNVAISPDGAQVAVLSADGKLMAYPTDGSAPRDLAPGRTLGPLLWTRDWLYVQEMGAYTQLPTRVSKLHLPSGKLAPWRDVGPSDSLGVNAITKIMLSGDASTCVFNYRRVLSELFVAEPAR
jgi:DNA-binding winged helix-turn-helix (wHTH) protein/WD40 repeat protein